MLLLLLAGCASNAQPSPPYAERWIGQKIDAFVVAHGPPQVRQPISAGRSVVEWADVFHTPNTGSPVQTLLGAAGNVQSQSGAYQLVCKLRFVVSQKGIIEQGVVVADTYGRYSTSRCAEVLSGR